ncbi:MAG TPA: glycosyltransferase family 39 protein [Acidimicrobiales bacterium]|nr:glycosyltransferase family 39 protein [Acidimicrobiales bacterium]
MTILVPDQDAAFPPPAPPGAGHGPTRAPRRAPGALGRFVRGRPEDPPWVRPALLTLLVGTAIAYLWGLGDSGWANSFYSAAVQAGTKSWKAFFFGSSDAANFITVDKPPAALWVMELSARLFGVNSWSILVPQALEGVATVGLLYATVRRWFSPGAALLAGSVVALTPVAALMFRFNNPDALLVLLLTAAAYATVRALEKGRTVWLVLAAALVGSGFLTKMLQALVVVPAIGIVYLVAAPVPLRRRIAQLVIAGAALAVSAGWWVAAVVLTPAADRPYIGGSQDDNLLNLIFGYNGFGRLTGNETGSVGASPAGASMWGPTGWTRMFNSAFGGQISWLIPAAAILLAAGLWVTRRAPRTDRTRAAFLLWGITSAATAATFSFAQGIIHPYYTVALAPAVGALVGMGVGTLWPLRHRVVGRCALAGALAATAVWSFVLLSRAPQWLPALRMLVLVGGLGAAGALAAAPRLRGRVALGLGAVALAAGLGGPAAYTLETVTTPHAGAIPSAGPVLAGAAGGPGGAFGPAAAGAARGAQAGGPPNGPVGVGPGGGAVSGAGNGAPFGAGAGTGNGFGPPTGAGGPPGASAGSQGPQGAGGTPGAGGAPGGATGGLLNGSTPGKALVALLERDAGRYTWVAATVGSNSASGYQLATDDPVMSIGGFNGSDPAPTLSQFAGLVRTGKIHYFIAGGAFGPGQGVTSSTSSQITSWVESHFGAQTVDGVQVYDLTATATA